jgi:hypothetical protein
MYRAETGKDPRTVTMRIEAEDATIAIRRFLAVNFPPPIKASWLVDENGKLRREWASGR